MELFLFPIHTSGRAMAEKTATKTAAAAPKGPPMIQVLHNGTPTWANRTMKGLYRCTACKSESHDKAPVQAQKK